MSLLDEIVRGVGEVFADIRHKVIEEPWFGREVTPTTDQAIEPKAARPDVMEAFFQGREVTREELGQPALDPNHSLGHDP